MLDVDSDLECPGSGPPSLPPVAARALLPACQRTRSVVRIWCWKREPVAARESMGMSSFTASPTAGAGGSPVHFVGQSCFTVLRYRGLARCW